MVEFSKLKEQTSPKVELCPNFYQELPIFNRKTGVVEVCAYDSFTDRVPLTEFRFVSLEKALTYSFGNTCESHVEYEKMMAESLKESAIQMNVDESYFTS